MKYIVTLCSLLLIIYSADAQNFKGRVTDSQGEALYGSSVYIKGLNQGLVCNEDGYYQSTIAPGQYKVEYKCLGFRTVEKNIRIKENETTIIDISLQENPFMLGEVTISKQEDPAYPIMRKAIANASIYANSVQEYTAEAYIKMNAELLKISSFLDKMASKEEGVKFSELKNQVFLQESFNEIQFTAPDRYKQTVKAFSSTIPDNFDSNDVTELINSSLYMPKVGMFISPLNPKAFSYYRFRYEGFSEENGLTVNKIRIESKVKDPVLVNGYIYIADDTWHIYSAELSTNVYGVKQKFTVTYQQLGEKIFLPITHFITSDVNILGLNALLNYYTSVTYKEITPNEAVIAQQVKEDKKKKKSFEIARWDSLYTIVSDSMAKKQDSLYWKNIRTIPLDEREAVSYVKKDSIQQRLDSTRKEFHDPSFSWGDLIDGGSFSIDSGKVRVEYEGIFRGLIHDYNFVDGLVMGQSFHIESKISEHNKLKVSPYIYYALSRKRIIGGGDIDLSYAPMRQGRIKLSGGSISEDYNPLGIHRLNNLSSSILRGKNYNFLYQKDFASAENEIDLANGLRLLTKFEIARRSGLTNTTDYTWGKKSRIRENIFPDDRFDKTAVSLGLNYTPYAYYTIRKGAKRYLKYSSPTYYVRYSEAFSAWQTNNARYHKLFGGLMQNARLNEFNSLIYEVEGGGFIGKKDRIHFADYQHFNTSDVIVNFKSPFTSFMLLDNYVASTNQYWVRTNINYESHYLLLKRLPFLQGKMFTETLHLKNLYTPDMKIYTEMGYSINLMKMLNLGAFASFRKGKYQDFGIRILMDWDMIKGIVD